MAELFLPFFKINIFQKETDTCNLKTDSTPSMISYYSVLYYSE